MLPHHSDEEVRGTFFMLGSALAYSLSGYFTRLLDLDLATVLVWRGVFGGAFVAGFVLWWGRRQPLAALARIDGPTFAVAALMATAMISFVGALRLSPVADVMMVSAAAPFLTAVLAFVVLGEREAWTTWVACLVAFLGVAVIVDPGAPSSHLAGHALAGLMALAYGAALIVIRRHRDVSMLPAACLSAWLTALVMMPFASPSAVTARDLGILFAFGTVQLGLGLLFTVLGGRLISAPRAVLVACLENPLAPFWVWLAFGETPSGRTLAGGALVMAAIVGDVVTKSMLARPRSSSGGPPRGRA